jgi:hypothetical protein
VTVRRHPQLHADLCYLLYGCFSILVSRACSFSGIISSISPTFCFSYSCVPSSSHFSFSQVTINLVLSIVLILSSFTLHPPPPLRQWLPSYTPFAPKD